MLGIRLNQWNDQIPGQCFNASKIALPNARHPYVDQIYLGVTSFYLFGLLLNIVHPRIIGTLIMQEGLLSVSIAQFILHV